MKTQFIFFCLALFVLYPVHLLGQDFPPVDHVQTFAIHSSATGQEIGRTPAQVKQIMGTPTSESHTYDEFFGKHIRMQFGTSILSFTEDFQFIYHFAELNDQHMFMKINGVDIRVGDLAQELAEHFPKSWAARRFNWPGGDGYPLNEIVLLDFGDISAVEFLIDPSTGVIRQIVYSTRLT